MAFAERNEITLLGWVSIDSRLYEVKLKGSRKLNNLRPDRCNLFVVSACAIADCSPNTPRHIFYQKMHNSSRTDFIEQPAGDENVAVDRLSSKVAHLEGPFVLG